MEFREVKEIFLTELVKQGVESHKQLQIAMPMPEIPERLKERWITRLHTLEPMQNIPLSPRVVNHFGLGADPEFYLFNAHKGVVAYAQEFGLHQGLAFGQDNNGRLVELRPEPSRFAFNVVASMITELKWMGALLPRTLGYSWISTPYLGDDGLGGHVHVGSKKNAADKTRVGIDALDLLTQIFLSAGVFDNAQNNNRRAARGGYGKFGDIRLQKHGFEYRTMPTWLETPQMAHLVLTCAKLAVYNPKLLPGRVLGGEQARSFIKNLLAYYQGLDDDARLAYNALMVHGMPLQRGRDFREVWGVDTKAKPSLNGRFYFPASIPASDEDRASLFAYLTKGLPIDKTLPKPNWPFHNANHGYVQIIHNVQTFHRPGLGEMIYDIFAHPTMVPQFHSNDTRYRTDVFIPEDTRALEKAAATLNAQFPGYDVNIRPQDRGRKDFLFYIGEEWRKGERAAAFKKFLLSGLFPLWSVDNLKAESFDEWKARVKVDEEKPLKGKEIKEVRF